jgi:modulator of FtsH protease
MNDQTIDYGYAVSTTEQRNKVLRNTYWLLALSLLPTVLGAWIGVATGITRGLTGGVGLIVFLAGAFGFMFAIEKTKNSAAGVPVLLAFTFFMGLMLSRMIAMVLGFKNGSELIMTAFGGTAGVFFVMASLASVIKRDLSGMGKWLFVGALAIMIGGIINVFVGSTVGMMVISVMAIGIFSAYMLYDLKRIIDGGETNYISATLAFTWTSSTCSRACWPCWASQAAARLIAARPRMKAPQWGRFGSLFHPARGGGSGVQSNTAMLSTCAVCGKHVHHARRTADGSPPWCTSSPRVARQRGRVAAHIDNAPGGVQPPHRWQRRRCQALRAWCMSARALASANAPSRGGSTSHLSASTIGHQHARGHLEQVARHKPRGRQRMCRAAAWLRA